MDIDNAVRYTGKIIKNNRKQDVQFIVRQEITGAFIVVMKNLTTQGGTFCGERDNKMDAIALADRLESDFEKMNAASNR